MRKSATCVAMAGLLSMKGCSPQAWSINSFFSSVLKPWLGLVHLHKIYR